MLVQVEKGFKGKSADAKVVIKVNSDNVARSDALESRPTGGHRGNAALTEMTGTWDSYVPIYSSHKGGHNTSRKGPGHHNRTFIRTDLCTLSINPSGVVKTPNRTFNDPGNRTPAKWEYAS